jgi:hypothetical protein
MDGFSFDSAVNKSIRDSVNSYANRSFTDTSVRVTEVNGQYYTGETVTGKTIRGISSGDGISFEVGQQISAQRSNGQWIARGSGVFKAGS